MFPQMKFWGSATVGSKGQVVIPVEARDELGIKEGEKLVVVGSAKAGVVSLVKAESLEHMMTMMQNDLMRIQKSVKTHREVNNE